MASLAWRFDNSYARLPAAFFSRQSPEPVRAPHLVVVNPALAARLGLDPASVDPAELAAAFSGNQPPPGAEPLAQAYAGHQFGHFTMLGDGRAILLGEHVAPDGQRFDIQLKGSGRTAYSRQGDGRAALGPMLREYIISEAMHALGIPTTRSLAVVSTGEPVYRDDILPGAILTRVASSHLRVGTFEYAAARGDLSALQALTTYTIARHYPDCAAADTPALALLDAVIARQVALITDWMRVGFVHGVMNTDNMALSGETIDYGPCAFLDAYAPQTVFSSIDRQGRYAFASQPLIAQWNLARFAETLLPLLHPDQPTAIALAEDRIIGVEARFADAWLAMMRRKLGLFGAEADDQALAEHFLDALHRNGADYTRAFRLLADANPTEDHPPSLADQPMLTGWGERADWVARWHQRLGRNPRPWRSSQCLMRQANPLYIPRNHQVEAALAAATSAGDLAPLHRLLDVLAAPTHHRDGLDAYANPPPEGGNTPYRTFCGT